MLNVSKVRWSCRNLMACLIKTWKIPVLCSLLFSVQDD